MAFATTLILAEEVSLGSTQMNIQHYLPVVPAAVSLARQARAVLLEIGNLLPPSCIVQAVLDDPDSTPRELSDAEFRRLEILAVVTQGMELDSSEPNRWAGELSSKMPDLHGRFEKLRQQDSVHFVISKPQKLRWGAPIGNIPQESQLNWAVTLSNPEFEKEFIARLSRDGAQDVSDWMTDWLVMKAGDDLLYSAWAVHEFLGKMDAGIRRVPRYIDRGDYSDAAPIYRTVAATVFRRLNEELGDPLEARGKGPLREATLRFALMAFTGLESTVGEQLKRRLVGIAKLDLAAMRGACSEGHTVEGYFEFNNRLQHFHACSTALCVFGSLAITLSQLLLMFRALSTPAVAADLSYWEADELTFPSGKFGNYFQFIPGALVGAVHKAGAIEAIQDPLLTEAREKLAEFCLSRLGQRKGEPKPEFASYAEPKTLVEPSRNWRVCYVRAVESLRMNPHGRGHHVLHWVTHHDPEPAVRAAAKETYAALRRQPSLKAGASPRRPLITALWWLFQAHRLDLGLPIDPIGAQASLTAFLRRTTEAETSADLLLNRPGLVFTGMVQTTRPPDH